MPVHPSVLQSFVSPLVAEFAAGDKRQASFPATVWMADLSGFTPLMDSFTRSGSAGLERVTQIVNGYFGQLIDRIGASGGQVVRFAGDALIAVWTDPDLGTAARSAVRCGEAIQRDLGSYEVDGVVLRLRVAVAAGDVRAAVVGGRLGRRELLLLGTPFLDMALAYAGAEPGDTAMSDAVAAFVEADPGNDPAASVVPYEADPAVLRAFVPNAVLTRLDAGLDGWLAELRTVTVLFIGIAGIDHHTVDAPERVDEALQAIQTVLYRHEGAVDKLLVDDKGLTVVAAFGLPPFTHADDAARGAITAVQVRDALAESGLTCSIGVTTGRLFCGPVGSATRREYTVLGAPVNLAARMMHARVGVWCDRATVDAAGGGLDFVDAEPILAKGTDEPIAVFTPRLREGAGAPPVGLTDRMVGRTEALQSLQSAVSQHRAGHGGVVIVQGEPGMGKTTLVRAAATAAAEAGLTVTVAYCDAVERGVAYLPWRPLFRRLAASWREDPRIPLLRSVLRQDLVDTPFTAGLGEEQRAANTLALCVDMLVGHAQNAASDRAPLTLVIEDIQWLDTASVALLERVARADVPLLLLLTRRAGTANTPLAPWMVRLGDSTIVTVEALSDAVAAEMAAERLGVQRLGDDLSSMVVRLARGNPFFVDQLVSALRVRGAVRVDTKGASLVGEVVGDDLNSLPETVDGLITSRLDRLSPSQQLTLKVASILGQVFHVDVLADVHPVADLDVVWDDLRDLELLRFVRRVGVDGRFTFDHAITRQVVHNHILHAHRRSLNEAAATNYEARVAVGQKVAHATIARHWQAAGRADRALLHLDKAGEAAIDAGAHAEAIEHLTRAGELSQESTAILADSLPQARRQERLGHAHAAVGSHDAGRRALTAGLSDLGWAPPAGGVYRAMVVAGEGIAQLAHRFGIRRRMPENQVDSALCAARMCEQLGYIYYPAGETMNGVYAALRMLNLTERVPVSQERARALATMGLAAAVVPWRGLSDRYLALAMDAVHAVERPTTTQYVHWVAGMCRAGFADWKAAAQDGRVALEAAESLRDGRMRVASQVLLAFVALHSGSVDAAIAHATASRSVAAESENRLWSMWAGNALAEALLVQNDVARAAILLEESIDTLADHADHAELVRARGLLAEARWAQGDTEDAARIARKTLTMIGGADISAFGAFEGYAGTARILLEHEAQDGARGPTDAALVELARFARVFPLARPRLWWLRSRKAGVRGGDASKPLTRAATLASSLCMPLEQERIGQAS